MDIVGASEKLSQLELQFELDGMKVTVLWFRVAEQSGGSLIGRHMHSSYEFHFIVSGCCRVTYAAGNFIVHPGEFYLTGPGVWHEQYGMDGGYTEYCLNCDIDTDAVLPGEGMLLMESLRRAGCRPIRDGGSIACFDRALEEAAGHRLGYYGAIRCLAAMTLTLAVRSACGDERVRYQVAQKSGKNDVRFRQIEQFVRDNVMNPITSADLESCLFLSGKQIGRIIRRFAGCTTRRYIAAARLQKAKSLLKDTNYSIKEISGMLGFSSEYYFSQFFKREEGYPPGMYRRNVQNS